MPIEFAYAQARIQARNGQRPTPGTWQSLEASEELAHYLHAVRGTSMKSWVINLGEHADTHFAERSLREGWRLEVERIEKWLPKRWRHAVLWVRTLADLPAAVYLQGGGGVHSWMQDDSSLQTIARADPDARWRGADATELAPIAPALSGEATALDAWRAHWRSLWPEVPGEHTGMDTLVRSLEAYLHRLSIDEAAGADPVDRRERLERQLVKITRRYRQLPAAVFAYLGLLALDLRRLRGGVARRALFATASGVV